MRRQHQAAVAIEPFGGRPTRAPGFDVARDQQIRLVDTCDAADWFDIESPPPEETLAAARTGQLLAHCLINAGILVYPILDKIVELPIEV